MKNLTDLELGLKETRDGFYTTTASIRDNLDEAFALFFDFVELVKPWIKTGDRNAYVVETSILAVTRVIAWFILLESGRADEAGMILRNGLESILIAIDILYNEDSLQKWIATGKDNLNTSDSQNWYFYYSRICERIEANPNGGYPELERILARYIREEWKRISNASVHAHSYAQVKRSQTGPGEFLLLGLKTTEEYLKDFDNLSTIIFNVVQLLIRIPSYRKNLGTLPPNSAPVKTFLEKYSSVQRRLETAQQKLGPKTKKELEAIIKTEGYSFDIANIPDDAIIEDLSFDFADPANPKMSVKYRPLSNNETANRTLTATHNRPRG